MVRLCVRDGAVAYCPIVGWRFVRLVGLVCEGQLPRGSLPRAPLMWGAVRSAEMFFSCVVRFIHTMSSLRATTATSFGHTALGVSTGSTLCHVLRSSALPPPIFPVSMSTMLMLNDAAQKAIPAEHLICLPVDWFSRTDIRRIMWQTSSLHPSK